MSRGPLQRLSSKPAMRVEEIDEMVALFDNSMREVAAELAAATAVEWEGDDRAELPDLSDPAQQALRSWLANETLALIEPDGPRGIEVHELQHEIQKKALVGLKREILAEVALGAKLKPANKLDELATQVARAYRWDEEAIARLILDYTEDPQETAGGHSTRIFTLTELADVDYMTPRLAYVDGRYYRTDIAKWFSFDSYQRVGSVLRVQGTLRSYKAGVDPTDQTRLTSASDPASCELEVRQGSSIALVHQAKNHTVARSMLAAFKVATRAEVRDYVHNAERDAEGGPRALHPATVFLLDVITNRLRGHLFRQRNAVLARFRLGSSNRSMSTASTQRPTLRAVRFEGENLLDSTTACGLMWTEGRPLVDVTISVAVTESDTDSFIRARVPIRIALENDAVLVQTGLVSDSNAAAEVHRAVVNHVEAAIEQGVTPDQEARFARIIRTQAERPDPEAEAQLLVDDGDAATDIL